MDFGKGVAVFFSLLILGQSYLVRRRAGTWLVPASLFGLFWFGYTFVPLVALLWVPIEPYGVVFIFLCIGAFSAGALPFDWALAVEQNAAKRESAAQVYGSVMLRRAFHVSAMGAVLFQILNLGAQGISLRDLFLDLQASVGAYAELLYSETLNDNVFDRIGTVLAYLAPSLGGMVLRTTASRRRWQVLLLSFLPAVLVAVTQTTKGLLFLCVALFYAGVLVSRIATGSLRLLERGSLKAMTVLGAGLISVATAAFVLRGLTEIEELDLLAERLRAYYASYACGHLYAFSDWFSSEVGGPSEFGYSFENTTYGFYTFAALFKLFGSEKVVPLGVFDEYFGDGELLLSNIYTMFRGLVHDFGLGGSLVFMVVTGLLFHWGFRAMLANRRPAFTVAVFVFMVGYFYNSFIISVPGWNRIYAGFVLLWALLEINRRRLGTAQEIRGCPVPAALSEASSLP